MVTFAIRGATLCRCAHNHCEHLRKVERKYRSYFSVFVDQSPWHSGTLYETIGSFQAFAPVGVPFQRYSPLKWPLSCEVIDKTTNSRHFRAPVFSRGPHFHGSLLAWSSPTVWQSLVESMERAVPPSWTTCNSAWWVIQSGGGVDAETPSTAQRSQNSSVQLVPSSLTVAQWSVAALWQCRSINRHLRFVILASRCRRTLSRLAGCFAISRQLHSVRRSLTRETLIYRRLDCCNAVLADLPCCQLNILQSIINAAARLVVSGGRSDRISHCI